MGCIAILLFGILYSLAGSVILYFVWNWTLPGLFNLPQITFFQALGLSLILNIIGSAIKSSNKGKTNLLQ